MHAKFIGTLVCSSGASAKDSDSSNKKADGTTGAIDLTGVAANTRLLVQATDAAFRLVQGSAASNSPGASYGPKVDVGQLYEIVYKGTGLAAIPASGSGAANVDLWVRTPAP